MVGWHHQLNGHKFEQTLRDSRGQSSLAFCSLWGQQESDTIQWLNSASEGSKSGKVFEGISLSEKIVSNAWSCLDQTGFRLMVMVKFIVTVLVCLCCYNKIPQSGWLIKPQTYLTVLESRSLRLGYQHEWVRALFCVGLPNCLMYFDQSISSFPFTGVYNSCV